MPDAVLPAPQAASRERISSVEFWRFFFTVMVCLYHLEIYLSVRNKLMPSGSGAVEFFFILAGFTIAMSAGKRALTPGAPVSPKRARELAVDYVKKKLKAIYPPLAAVLLLGLVVYPLLGVKSAAGVQGLPEPGIAGSVANIEWELLMLVGTPFGMNNYMAPIVPLWFLTPLLLVGYVYTYAIYRHYEFTVFAAPAVGVLFYIFFTLNSNMMLDHGVKMGFLNAGAVHAVAEMSFGVAAYTLYERLRDRKFSRFWVIALSLLEIYAIYRLLALTFYQPVSLDNFRRIPYIIMLILFSFLNVTYFSRFMNKPFWRGFGRVSLAMYLAHVHLAQAYIQGVALLKEKLLGAYASPEMSAWLFFLRDAGNYRGVSMTWKDVLLFTLFTAFAALLITGATAGVRRAVRAALSFSS